MPQKLFEQTELVSSNDPNIDQSELVYMGSDSEESCLLHEVVHNPSNTESDDRSGNPIHVLVKERPREEEILGLLAVREPEGGVEFQVGDLVDNGIETDPIVSIIREEEICDNSMPLDYIEEDTTIIKVEPPSGMPEPPPMSEPFQIEGFDENDREIAQFEIVSRPLLVPKAEPEEVRSVINEPPTDAIAQESAAPETKVEIQIDGVKNEKTEDAESPSTTVVSVGDTSLVDHPYSQSESNNKEFCEDLVQDLLRDTGNENNRSVVELLAKFTGLLENFFDVDENAQSSLYIQNMKKSLEKIKIEKTKIEPDIQMPKLETQIKSTPPKRRSSEPSTSFSVIDISHPKFSVVLETETESESLTDTIDLTQYDLPPTQESENMEVDLVTELKEVANEIGESEVKHQADSEAVTKLKDQILRIETLGNKIVKGVEPLKVVNDENIVELQGKVSALLKESREEIRAISADILTCSRSAAEINEEIKARLVNASTDDLSSDSDDERVKKRRRKPKTQPAVVSSTKEDSDATDASAVKAAEVEDMSESDDNKELRDPNKEIDKLLDFTTLDHAKPVSSRKVSKQKKLRKLKKRKASDSESLHTSSSDASFESSSTENEGEKTDEEEKMRLRQNENARDDLLADSDAAESDYSDQSGLSVLFSSDEETELAKKALDKSKPDKQKPQASKAKSSDDETSVSSEDESKKLENGFKSSPKEGEKEGEAKITKDEDDSSTDASSDEAKAKKKRIRRDSDEREIFSKNFLDGTPTIKKSNSQSQSSSSAQSPSKRERAENLQDKTPGTPPDDKGLIDLTMFNQKRNNIDADIDIFENRTNRNDGAGPSNQNKRPAPPPIQDDEFIYLSSDSDSEISAPASGSGSTSTIPKRKKMLSEEELQEETKRAQKEETKRLERLKKKDETLTELMTQRMSQESGKGFEELILDYDPKPEVTISVHEKLVKSLKEHQREGIKFMYDTCFGSIGDEIRTESGCILAHCMGLGKTLQLITLLHTLISYPEQLKIAKVIVICPKSTIMNWFEEFGKWLKDIPTRNLKVFYFKDQMVLNEKIKVVEQWFNWKAPSVLLVNYESFRYMVHYSGSKRAKIPEPEDEVKRKQEIIGRCLLNPGPNLVVCDEGHIIKNQASATNRAIVKIKTRRRIVLTGTPVQNNLNEYYSMVDWIKPALLGTVREFNNLYANPIKDGQHIDSTPQMIKKMKQRSFILNRKLSKFVQRKEVSVLQQYLPQLYQYCLFVPLTTVQETLYEKFLALNPLDGGHQLLNDYTALRKIWTHPKVLQNAYERAVSGDLKIEDSNKKKYRLADDEDNDEPDDRLDIIDGNTGVKSRWWMQFVSENNLESIKTSNKLMTLFYILRLCQMKNQKCLVFSSFVAVLNVVEYFMKKINNQRSDPVNSSKYGYDEFKINGNDISWINGLDYCRLDGSTKREHRQMMIEKFNDSTNKRLRCFLISAKAGGQGINLTGASRCVILDTSWNPSSDQQNIFRIYRLGQKHPCYVYRLIALGTMEEKVYSRSVTKQAMSGRVVDKRQIDRHYKMSELSELYVLTKTDYTARPNPLMPADEFLKFLLHTYPNQVYKYHDHERLLENKPDQDLNDDEKDEAWKLYEAELSGNPRVPPNVPLLNNENMSRPELMASLNFLAAAASSSSALDPSGLFSKYYPPTSFFPNDFLNMMPYDLSGSYRNALNPLATSVGGSLASTSSAASAMLRTQLNASLPPPPLYGPYPQLYNLPKPTTSPKPQNAPRRRPSNTTKTTPTATVPKGAPRNNGAILERLGNQDFLMGKNSSENLVILPDDDSNDSLDNSSASTSNQIPFKEGPLTKVVTKIVPKNSSLDKNAGSSVQPRKMTTVRPNLNIPRPSLASMPSRNSSPSNLPGTAARTHTTPEALSSAFMKVKSATTLGNNLLQQGNLLLPNVVPRTNTSDNIYINTKNKSGSGAIAPTKQMQKNSNLQSIAQRTQFKPVQQTRAPISVPVPPIPSGMKQQVKKPQNVPKKSLPAASNVIRIPPTPKTPEKISISQQQSPSIQRGFISSLPQKQQPSQTQSSPMAIHSAYSLAKDPLSGTVSTSSTVSPQTNVLKNLPKQSFIPQNRSSFTPQNKVNSGASTSKAVQKLDQKEQQRKIDQVVAQHKNSIQQQQASKLKIVQGNNKAPNVPKAVENSMSITKIIPRTDPKFITMPKSLQSKPAGSSIALTTRSPSQSVISTPSGKSNALITKSPAQSVMRIVQPAVTKSQQQTIIRSPVVRTPSQQQLAKGSSQVIVPRVLSAGTSNSQPRVPITQQPTQQSVQNRVIAGVKRKHESPQNPEATKRFSLGLNNPIFRVPTREQREKALQNKPSDIEDIVEIE